jgi:RND family efflux transporter MFP subunit
MLLGCSRGAPTSKAPTPQTVEVARAKPASPRSTVVVTGVLVRQHQINLSFRIPGNIAQLSVDDGDTLTVGQPVATLDPVTTDARLAQAQADLQYAKRELARIAPLVKRGMASTQELDDRKTKIAEANAVYVAARFDKRSATLVSPVNGVVLARLAQAGEVVQAGQTIISIADDDSPLLLRVFVPVRNVSSIHLSSPVSVSTDVSLRSSVVGHIVRIGQSASSYSDSVEFQIAIPSSPALKSGMLARATITTDIDQRATSYHFERVPAEAILEVNGTRAYVLRVDKRQIAIRTSVTFGGFDGDDALISGLQPGTPVITAGAGFVGDGQRVTVLELSHIDKSDGGS